MREGSGGESTVDHGSDLPSGASEGLEEILRGHIIGEDEDQDANGVDSRGPFISKVLGIADCEFLPSSFTIAAHQVFLRWITLSASA